MNKLALPTFLLAFLLVFSAPFVLAQPVCDQPAPNADDEGYASYATTCPAQALKADLDAAMEQFGSDATQWSAEVRAAVMEAVKNGKVEPGKSLLALASHDKAVRSLFATATTEEFTTMRDSALTFFERPGAFYGESARQFISYLTGGTVAMPLTDKPPVTVFFKRTGKDTGEVFMLVPKQSAHYVLSPHYPQGSQLVTTDKGLVLRFPDASGKPVDFAAPEGSRVRAAPNSGGILDLSLKGRTKPVTVDPKYVASVSTTKDSLFVQMRTGHIITTELQTDLKAGAFVEVKGEKKTKVSIKEPGASKWSHVRVADGRSASIFTTPDSFQVDGEFDMLAWDSRGQAVHIERSPQEITDKKKLSVFVGKGNPTLSLAGNAVVIRKDDRLGPGQMPLEVVGKAVMSTRLDNGNVMKSKPGVKGQVWGFDGAGNAQMLRSASAKAIQDEARTQARSAWKEYEKAAAKLENEKNPKGEYATSPVDQAKWNVKLHEQDSKKSIKTLKQANKEGEQRLEAQIKQMKKDKGSASAIKALEQDLKNLKDTNKQLVKAEEKAAKAKKKRLELTVKAVKKTFENREKSLKEWAKTLPKRSGKEKDQFTYEALLKSKLDVKLGGYTIVSEKGVASVDLSVPVNKDFHGVYYGQDFKPSVKLISLAGQEPVPFKLRWGKRFIVQGPGEEVVRNQDGKQVGAFRMKVNIDIVEKTPPDAKAEFVPLPGEENIVSTTTVTLNRKEAMLALGGKRAARAAKPGDIPLLTTTTFDDGRIRGEISVQEFTKDMGKILWFDIGDIAQKKLMKESLASSTYSGKGILSALTSMASQAPGLQDDTVLAEAPRMLGQALEYFSSPANPDMASYVLDSKKFASLAFEYVPQYLKVKEKNAKGELVDKTLKLSVLDAARVQERMLTDMLDKNLVINPAGENSRKATIKEFQEYYGLADKTREEVTEFMKAYLPTVQVPTSVGLFGTNYDPADIALARLLIRPNLPKFAVSMRTLDKDGRPFEFKTTAGSAITPKLSKETYLSIVNNNVVPGIVNILYPPAQQTKQQLEALPKSSLFGKLQAFGTIDTSQLYVPDFIRTYMLWASGKLGNARYEPAYGFYDPFSTVYTSKLIATLHADQTRNAAQQWGLP